jgi:hypothetical protein
LELVCAPWFVSFGSERFLLVELFAVRGDFHWRIEVWCFAVSTRARPPFLCPILVREHSDHRQGFVLFLESTVAVVIPGCSFDFAAGSDLCLASILVLAFM